MKLKWIAVGTAVLLVLAVVAVAVTRMQEPQRPERVGQPLLDLTLLSRATELHIQDGDAEVTLRSAEGQWVVQQAGDFPADEEKLTGFLLELTEQHPSHLVTTERDKLAELRLLTPEEAGDDGQATGTVLTVRNGEGEPIYRLIVGRDRTAEGRGGQYVRFPGEQAGYLVTASVLEDTQPADWLRRSILPGDFESLYQRIHVRTADGAELVFRRADAEADWELEGTPPERLRGTAAEGLARRLSRLELTRLASADRPAAELGREQVHTVEVALFDGRRYTLEIGSQAVHEDQHYVTARATAGDDAGDDAGEEQKAAVAAFNARFEGRAFAIEQYDASRLVEKREMYLKQEDQQSEPQ